MAAAGAACGPCGLDRLVCNDGELVCDGATDCGYGRSCVTDAQCELGGCMAGRCAPPGMAFIPAGTFEMGSLPTEPGHVEGELAHPIRLSRHYFMGVHEVTRREWRAVMDHDPSFFDGCGDECPMENVTWLEALAYANARSRAEGLEPCYDLSTCGGVPGISYSCEFPITFELDCTGYRLPTEAEWEHAYRALTTTAFYNGDPEDGDTCDQPLLQEIAQFCGNCSVAYEPQYDCSADGARPDQPTDCGPARVGSHEPNRWGLHDMAGNVGELVWDTYGPYPDFAEDPTGPEMQDGSSIVRGSNFCGHIARLRAADRKTTTWVQRVPFTGFRLVRTYRIALPEERVGDDLCVNGCGGCRRFSPELGTPCGPCGAGAYVCDGPEDVRCDPGPTECGYGEQCASDSDCTIGHCSQGHCAADGWVYVPTGALAMGSLPSERFRNANETLHDVRITRPFMMQQHELTQTEWGRLMGYNPSAFPACGGDCPVDQISWLDALVFANTLSRSQGLEECYDLSACTGAQRETFICPFELTFDPECTGYRLPTEAEWEHAYRAGVGTAYYNGDPTTTQLCAQPPLDEIAQYCGNCSVSYEGSIDCTAFGGGPDCGVAPVGARAPNAWDLFDMAGNVRELVWDVIDAYPEYATDPIGPPHSGQSNITRGGNFCGNAGALRAAARDEVTRVARRVGTGVRLVRSMTPDGTVGTSCDNGCGGCSPVTPRPGLPCGPCAADAYECSSLIRTVCDGATATCRIGASCSTDLECPAGWCSNGHCSVSGFAYVPAGAFTMGSPPGEASRDADETEHPVTLTRAILVQQHEVTQREWFGLMGSNPSAFRACGSDCPVESVTWLDALAFANTLSRSQGLDECYDFTGCTGTPGANFICPFTLAFDPGCPGYRLPTEAEWEYAYRAGASTALHNGSPTSTSPCAQPLLHDIARYCGNCEVEYEGAFDCSPFGGSPRCGTAPVGSFAPNAWGLYDMSGNASELVWDVYFEYPASATDPAGPPHMGEQNIIRGGAFCAGLPRMRAADRSTLTRITRRTGVGFRVVRGVP